jgi:histidine triad (HIT) family protein
MPTRMKNLSTSPSGHGTASNSSSRRCVQHRWHRDMIELPHQEPCELCEGMAGRDPKWALIDECRHTMTVINPYQYEVGQCCVITRRHVGTLLDLSEDEAAAVLKAAKRVAIALVGAYRPLGILTFQNNGAYSGQEVPHYHFHVVPRQPGSNWGIGPPQLATFDSAGRVRGTSHDPSGDRERQGRVRVDALVLHETAKTIRTHLPT